MSKTVSVLLELSMFPMDKGESVSPYVSEIVKMLRDTHVDHQLTAMGTLIETDTMSQALALVERAYDTLDKLGCNRVYATVKFDIRKGKTDRLSQKVQSVTEKIGHIESVT
uniref:Uncharacterized protein, MTH1187 family n=1 Tax=Candidatus Kentrum eta TaxID=2126337 RepID=A0A450UTB3_9GAMM|nr:MAG: uncharacterized protein, MTH1187 family [Candidatus Kentron sp. H]VFJ89078.1 MAG: uncharacterized protein, MTH1187 family [Candidatus Kentron sp. H]VFJ95767.1 MAG: uncharacterized protein, MTH1187 family [Candidatus Kentron sp. H]